jgi:hypothetical protein
MLISLLNNSVGLFHSVLNSNLRHLFNYLKSGALHSISSSHSDSAEKKDKRIMKKRKNEIKRKEE